MSGGHWDYLSSQLEERGSGQSEVWRLIAVIEYEMDWGISGDTCKECAYNRVPLAMEAFFDTGAAEADTAISVMRDRNQYLCDECSSREQKEKENEA